MSTAIIQATLGGAPDTIVFDGNPHRFKTGDSAKRNDNGWYIAHLAHGFPVIVFGDWRDPGTRYKILGDQLADDVDLEKSRREQLASEKKKQCFAESAAVTAERLWRFGKPCYEHSYLTKKGIQAHGVKRLHINNQINSFFKKWIIDNELEDSLVVPMMRFNKIVDVELITVDKKRYLPKALHTGAYYVMGNIEEKRIIVATGFATCASLRECIGLTVICSFSDSNIDPVMSDILRKYPDKEIIIAADNDIRTDKKIINSGIVYSEAAARKYNCLVVIPRMNNEKVDFNDIHSVLGKQAVIDQFATVYNPRLRRIEVSPYKAGLLLDDAIDDWLDSQDDVGIQAPAGLGKSTRTLTKIQERDLRCDYFVPSYALALEQAERLPKGKAIAIRGRTHQTETMKPLCEKWETAYHLEKCGLAHKTMRLLCGTIDHVTGSRPCPYAGHCGYLQQFYSDAPIRLLAHEYLSLDSNRLTKRAIDVAVVDESFHDSLEKFNKWSVGELIEQSEPVYKELVTAIINGRLLSMNSVLNVIDEILNAEEDIESNLQPEMDAQTAVTKVKPLLEARRKPTSFLWNCKKAIESNGVNRLWFKNIKNTGFILAVWTKPISFIAKDTPTAFIDASLVESIVKKVKPDCRIVKIDAIRQAHITQITDSALSKTRLETDADYLSSRLIEFISRQAKVNPNGAVIAQKFWIEAHGEKLPATVKAAHYGALRGLNALEGCDWLVQIGRIQPQPQGVEEIVRAWFPDATLTLPGAYIQQQKTLTAKDGTGVVVWTQTHPDSRCAEVLESIREQESLQALDRLRLIHGKVKKIWLFTNLPLPGIEPDELATLDGLTLPGRLAEVALRDSVVITGRKELSERYPDVFPTEKSAERFISDIDLNAPDPNRSPIRSWGIYNQYIDIIEEKNIEKNKFIEFNNLEIINQATYPTVNYRLAGQPGKPRTAIVPHGDEGLEERLEAIHGKPVKIMRTPEQQLVSDFCKSGMPDDEVLLALLAQSVKGLTRDQLLRTLCWSDERFISVKDRLMISGKIVSNGGVWTVK